MALGALVPSSLKSLAASAIMAWVVSDLVKLGAWERGGNDLTNILVVAGTVLFGAAVYAAAAYLLRCEELGIIVRSLRRRGSPG